MKLASLVNFRYYSVLALDFGFGVDFEGDFGGSAGALVTKALDDLALRLERITTIANMIMETINATIKEVIHVSRAMIDTGNETPETSRDAVLYTTPSLVTIPMFIVPAVKSCAALPSVGIVNSTSL